jgi:hypothetical protein
MYPQYNNNVIILKMYKKEKKNSQEKWKECQIVNQETFLTLALLKIFVSLIQQDDGCPALPLVLRTQS